MTLRRATLMLMLSMSSLTACSLDPAHRDVGWRPENTPDKNVQAMLAYPGDWHAGRHDPEQLAPLAVEAIELFRKNKIPELPKEDRGFKPSGSQ